MIDVIKNSKKIVATISLSKSMSCGAVLLTFGTEGYRFAGLNSTVMIHEVSSMTFGKITEIKADAAEADRLNNIIFSMMDKNCLKSDGYFKDIVHSKCHADWYLDSNECLKHNLINKIGLPKFKVKVSLDFSMES